MTTSIETFQPHKMQLGMIEQAQDSPSEPRGQLVDDESIVNNVAA